MATKTRKQKKTPKRSPKRTSKPEKLAAKRSAAKKPAAKKPAAKKPAARKPAAKKPAAKKPAATKPVATKPAAKTPEAATTKASTKAAATKAATAKAAPLGEHSAASELVQPTAELPASPSIYTGYVAGVAANVEKFGLAFALETCLEMYIYEFQDELAQLKQAAIAGLAAREFAPIVELANARGIETFTETDAETMLRGLAEANAEPPDNN